MPMRGGWGGSVFTDLAPETSYDFDRQAVSPGYFTTLRLTLLRGRFLTPDDRAGRSPVVNISQTLARTAFGDVDPIGRHVRNRNTEPWATVVGVVSDIRRGGKEAEIRGQIYIPALQPELYTVVPLADFAVRSAGDPHELVSSIQREVLALDKDLPVTRVRTLEEIISESVAEKRFQTVLLLIFAGLAVGLAMIGVFGVLSYSVSQRTNELGIRIALGAQPASIVRMVLRQAGVLIACGAAAGLAGGYALSRFVAGMLFQVKPHDAATYGIAAAILAAVSLAAALIPARRGAKVDPIVNLRYE
jgi:predicted permease